MKKLLALALALIMVLSMVPAMAAEEPVTVTIWSREAESQDPTAPGSRYLAWAQKWNDTHEDIKIDFVLGQSHDGMVTAMANAGGPDIVDLLWQYAVPMGKMGALVELSDYINNDEDWDADDILDIAWNTCGVDGEIYAVPRQCNSAYILYSPAKLAAAGYETFPTTMEGIKQAAKDTTVVENGEITVMGMNPICPWQDDVLWAAAYGADWVDAEGNVNFDSEEIRGAYSFLRELIEFYGGYEVVSEWSTTYSNQLVTTNDPIFTGACAMRFIFDWSMADLYVYAEEAGMKYGVDYALAALPHGMLTCATMQMSANSQNKDAAWEVLSYLTSAEVQADLAMGRENKGQYEPRVSALNVLANADVGETVKYGAQVMAEGNLKNFTNSAYVTEYLNAIGTYMGDYLRGYIDLDEAVECVQEEVEAAKEAAGV